MNDNVEEVAEVCDLAAQCIDDVINTNPDIFQADGNNITTMSLNESYEFNRVQLVTDVVQDYQARQRRFGQTGEHDLSFGSRSTSMVI